MVWTVIEDCRMEGEKRRQRKASSDTIDSSTTMTELASGEANSATSLMHAKQNGSSDSLGASYQITSDYARRASTRCARCDAEFGGVVRLLHTRASAVVCRRCGQRFCKRCIATSHGAAAGVVATSASAAAICWDCRKTEVC